ncbi:HAMP domain-containing histidine kinase [Paracoccus sp. M683]|nr:HAMP domain-containing histidine kinase [Paracoccus sp. M683]
MSRFLRSTSARLSLRFAALYAIITAIVFVLTAIFANREITEWVSDQLAEDAAGFAQLYQRAGLDAVLAKLDGFAGFNFEDYRIYLLEDAGGRIIAGNVANIDWHGTSGHVPADTVSPVHPRYHEVIGYHLHAVDLGPNRLTLGTSTYFLEELREVLVRGFAIGFVMLLLAGLIAGVIVGRRTERRLTQISSTLKAVAAGQLGTRAPTSGGEGDDLVRVADEINSTIAQLQRMVESQKQISADIAHDLRTPMQRLRQRLDAMQQSGKLSAQTEEDVQAATEIVDHLIETFHSLLSIAQIEAGRRSEHFTTITLAPILARIEDAYGAVADENGQTLIVTVGNAEAAVQGDGHLLTQMIANVVENALRHSPAGARVEVTLSAGPSGITVEIADDGPGIPADERDKVMRRFYRLEKSRTTPGNGLGLSMVKAIADLHGARVEMQDNHPGLRVWIRFQ